MNKLTLIIAFTAITVSIISCKNGVKTDEASTGEAQTAKSNSEAVRMPLDLTKSKLEWVGTKISGRHNGTINLKSGDLQVSNGVVVGGNFIVDMNSIVSVGPEGMDEESKGMLSGHLKSPDFFDVATYPDATFIITSLKPFSGSAVITNDGDFEEINQYKVNDPTHTIAGNLTIRGITKGIEFPAKIVNDATGISAIAKFNFNRTQWDVKFPGMKDDAISNSIYLGILLTAK